MLLTNLAPLRLRLKRELPPSVPVPAIVQTLLCREWFIPYVERCRERYGSRFTVYPVDMPPLVFLGDPGDIHAVIAAPPTTLQPGAGGSLVAPLIGESSFMLCDGERHKYGRNTVLPAFHRKAVQRHTEMVVDTTRREVASWPRNVPLALHPRLHTLMLKVILKTIFLDEDHCQDMLHRRLLGSLAVTEGALLQAPALRHLPGWGASWRGFLKRRARADELLLEIIRTRRARLGRGDLLDMLIAARNPDGSAMSDGQVRDNLMSMILAGHETTTAELAWAFQLLAHNERAQNRLLAEIDAGAGDRYLTATLNETLRHRPAFPFLIPRAVVAPIEIGGCTYRPPARLLGCTYLMHHDPSLYPQPQAFRPERFLEETPHSGIWLPWGAGTKSCVGRHFALLEMQTVLREVLSLLRVLPACSRIERARWRSAVLVPHAGSTVVLRERQPPRRRGAKRRGREVAGVA
ncbi:MAG TPA: cytochrome P450 [Solirubrobacteraceae bacterium]|jgi:cytochrome P450|nr:cytochrome P450 [Solirubrobacteraceae bacterium]